MPTDLRTTPDHPANVIETAVAEAEMTTGSLTRDGMRKAATTLRAYETAHGVTFATLDNKALDAVRAAYAGLDDSPARRGEPVLDLLFALSDLLGLGT